MGRSGVSSRRKYSKKKSLKVSSEGHRKKKSSRNKSKKLRHHDDSLSSSDYESSTSSSLVSSSSSEDDYKSRRSRSRTRNEVKGSRKRSRKRSLSEDSSHDSLPVKKKRKGSKKKGDSHTRKKNKKTKKKKSRKVAYRSDSVSCSTCNDEDSSSDTDEEVSRGRSRDKKKDHKDSRKGSNGNRKNRNRPRSSSPSKLSNSYDDDDENIENILVENNSRRLKSIIRIADPPEMEEYDNMKKDELKEEIVYDYDDYPSCRSNDSNDGENKKELVDHYSNISSEKRSVIGEVNSDSNPKDNKSISEVNNLELILRQKALENLSKFRGGLQTKKVVNVDDKHKNNQNDIKQSTSASFSTMSGSPPVIQRSRFTWRREASVSKGKEEKAANRVGEESVGLETANLPLKSSVENKTKITERISDKNINDGEKKEETSGVGNPKEEGSSKEQQTETNNSQFEKKTMTVMRGGEMVQVSYKVYIPNRAPALARRQLKR